MRMLSASMPCISLLNIVVIPCAIMLVLRTYDNVGPLIMISPLVQNTDAGTMSPYEHGEVYVLDDGGESDLDLGNYERFLETTLTRDHNITTGKVYQQVRC